MSSVAENEKRAVFKHYLELPQELRMGINEEMEVEDRCRFTRCSSLCQKEVRKSKNYVHGLEFNNFNKEHLEIHVKHKPRSAENTSFGGYILKFVKNGDEKSIEYLVDRESVSYTVDLDPDEIIDLSQAALEYFENLLQLYQNTIKELILDGTQNFNFQITSLTNLEKLEIKNHFDFRNLTSKLRHPLKTMILYSTRDKVLEDCEKICQVQEFFESYGMKMRNDQFLRFSAKKMIMDIGELTENDLFDFINSWQNGSIRENFEKCTWNLTDSKFNIQYLLDLLKIGNTDLKCEEFVVKHNTEAGKFAKLRLQNMGMWKILDFSVSIDNK